MIAPKTLAHCGRCGRFSGSITGLLEHYESAHGGVPAVRPSGEDRVVMVPVVEPRLEVAS